MSRTYAREIQTPEHGFGLDGLTCAPAATAWSASSTASTTASGTRRRTPTSPTTTPPATSPASARLKRTLLRETGLDERTAAPVLGIVSRLTPQKGFDLCFEVLPELLARRDLRLIALGSGEPQYEDFFQWLQWRFPGKAWFYRGFNEPLAHWIEAGADIFLMPSRFEPCGLNQMYSLQLRHPARRPQDRRPRRHRRALRLRHRRGDRLRLRPLRRRGPALGPRLRARHLPHRPTWERLMHNGMAKDFSWDVQGEEYVELYRRLAG